MPPIISTRKRVVALSLVMVCLLSAAPAMAAPAPQDARRAERERLQRVMEPSADVEEFRRELTDYFNELEGVVRTLESVPAVRQKFAKSGLRPLAALSAGRLQVAQLTYSDLVLMRAAYARNPGWREAPRALNSLLRPALRERFAVKVAATAEDDVPLPNPVADSCSDGISAGVTNTDLSISEAVVIAAETTMEALPSDALTVVGHATAAVALGVAKGALLALQTLKAIADDCNGATFETAIQQQVTNAQSAIISNDNSNKTTIVNNDNTNKTTIVANSDANRVAIIADAAANKAAVFTKIGDTAAAIIANDDANKAAIVANDNANKAAIIANDNANTTFLLRVAIEADLSAEPSAVPVALFETPETQCSGAAPFNQCGLLGMTRVIVVQTIARLAGASTAQANSFLAKGDTYRAAGDYRAAYHQYRLAYKAAAK